MRVKAVGTLLDRSYSVSQVLFPSPTPNQPNRALLISMIRRHCGMLCRGDRLVGIPGHPEEPDCSNCSLLRNPRWLQHFRQLGHS